MQQLLAQAPPDVTGALIEYGALGLLAILLVIAVRVLFARVAAAADAERARADRNEEELRKLHAAVQEKYLTTLAEATRVMGEALTQMREDREDRR